MGRHRIRAWRKVPVQQVMAELRRLNFGQPPRTYAECLAVARRLNWKLRIQPRETEEGACLSEQKRAIYLPITENEEELVRRILHEFAEIIIRKEGGEPEYWYAGGEEEHHRVAQLVEAAWLRQAARQAEFCLFGEIPPAPGDADAPPPNEDTLTEPEQVQIGCWYEAATALNALKTQAELLRRQLARVERSQARIQQEWPLR